MVDSCRWSKKHVSGRLACHLNADQLTLNYLLWQKRYFIDNTVLLIIDDLLFQTQLARFHIRKIYFTLLCNYLKYPETELLNKVAVMFKDWKITNINFSNN